MLAGRGGGGRTWSSCGGRVSGKNGRVVFFFFLFWRIYDGPRMCARESHADGGYFLGLTITDIPKRNKKGKRTAA